MQDVAICPTGQPDAATFVGPTHFEVVHCDDSTRASRPRDRQRFAPAEEAAGSA
jgi:hypothetical protein